MPALDAAGRTVGPNALTALLPGDIGLAQGVFSPGQYAASIGTLTTAGAPDYILNFGYGVPLAGRWGGPALVAYGANYLAPMGTALSWNGFGYPWTAGFAYGAPAAYAWNAAWTNGAYVYPSWPVSPGIGAAWAWPAWGVKGLGMNGFGVNGWRE